MRLQNPPQTHIDKAKQIERYLRRSVIGSVYAGLGVLYAVLVSAIFAGLIHGSLLEATPITIAVFVAILVVPAGAVFLVFFVGPNEPISLALIASANKWRRPLHTPPQLYTFRELMMNGEACCIKISFFLPAESHAGEVKEKIYNYVHGVLREECGSRMGPPTRLEIQNLIEAPMEILASECDIPILYWAIREVYEIQTAFGWTQNSNSPLYWAGKGA